jgi:hypothetical protein
MHSDPQEASSVLRECSDSRGKSVGRSHVSDQTLAGPRGRARNDKADSHAHDRQVPPRHRGPACSVLGAIIKLESRFGLTAEQRRYASCPREGIRMMM